MLPSLPNFAHLPGAVVVVALLVILVIAPLVSALAARRAIPEGRAKTARYARTMLIMWAITALALYAMRLRGQSPADVGIMPPALPLAAYGSALALVALPALANARRTRSMRFADYHERVRRVIPLTPSEWAWFVPVAFTAGICEEFLYRGYALTTLAALSGQVWLGVVLSTLAFGVAHAYQGWRGVAGTSILGLLFAMLYLAFGSLYPCMLAHVLQDLVGGAMLSRRLTRGAAEHDELTIEATEASGTAAEVFSP